MKSSEHDSKTTWLEFVKCLLWTPLGDLVHGRITGRGNWTRQLNDALLPDEIDKAIRASAKGQPFWRQTNHAVALIESSLTAGQDARQVAATIRADAGIPETYDSDDPLPQSVVDAVQQIVTRTRVGAKKRRAITNELFMHARTLLQQGDSEESVALPMLIRQTGGTPGVIGLTIPEPIRAVINDVIRRTKIWKSEKADVAGELAAHFQDGLDSGRTEKELLESFGSIKAIASLIRRSRIRCRPLTWKLWRRSWQIAAAATAVVVVCWSVLIVRFRSATPNITFDWVAEHDAIASAIPIDDRAWPLYREGLLKLGPTLSEAFTQFTGEDQAVSVLETGPVSPEWPHAVEFLNIHSESAELFLRGTEKPRFGFAHRSQDNLEWIHWSQNGAEDGEYNPPGTLTFATLLEHISELRTVRAFIAGRMFQAAEEGDSNTVFRCFAGLVRLGEHAREDGLTVTTLCGLWPVQRAATNVAWVVQTYPHLFDDEQLCEVHDVLVSVLQADWEIDPSRDAQLFFDEFLQHAYSPDGRFTPNGLQDLSQCSHWVGHQTLAYAAAIDGDDESSSLSERLMFNIRGSEAAAWTADRKPMKRKFR
jgi:hypothetical protein